MPIFMLKFSLKLSLHHKLVRVVAQSRKEFMTIGYRQSRIFLFRQSTVSLFFENADMSAPAAKNSMRIIPFCTLSSENKSINRLYRRLFS